MKEAKNELLQFVGGVIMLVVGLYILSQKVMVSSSYGFFSLWGGRFSSGLIMVPLIIGVVWMFASGGSFVSKVFTVLSVILIIAAIVASTRIWLVTITMYEWVLILVLIFGGAGFGHGDRPNDFTGGHLRQPLLALGVVADMQHVGGDNIGMHGQACGQRSEVSARGFFQHHH